MSIFEDLACVAWKSNPLFWQAVGGLHAAKTAGAIKNRSQCESLAKEGAAQFGIPSLIGNTAASCACKAVFDDDTSSKPPATWHGWFPLGGQMVGEPAVRSRQSQITDVFARGQDDRLWQKSWDHDHWTDWQPHNDGFVLASSPVADSMGPDHIHLFVRGTDNQLWQKWWA
jgi:hypothetical protein